MLVEREHELATITGLLGSGGGVLVVEGRAGIGKTSLLGEALEHAAGLGYDVLWARGSQLEAGFAFGVVRQLFERRVATAAPAELELLLAGPAVAASALLSGSPGEQAADGSSFAVLHGLYWLAANLAAGSPLMIVVDDAHWADEASLRWLAYLAPRIDGLGVALLVALRPGESVASGGPLASLRSDATAIVRPALLTAAGVAGIVRASYSEAASNELCAAAYEASGGNPLYLRELLRAAQRDDRPLDDADPASLLAGHEEIARFVVTRVVGFDPTALRLAQALSVLGDGCELRHAAMIAALTMPEATRLAAALTRLEVLAPGESLRFIHPVLREAVEASMDTAARDHAHRLAARALHGDGAPAGRVAAHLVAVRPAGDEWVTARLREAAGAAMETGSPTSAAVLLRRALAEPPVGAERVDVLCEAARAEARAGHSSAFELLEEALGRVTEPRDRARLALEIAETYAALFRWVDAVDVLELALSELGDSDAALAARLEAELVVSGLHDARRADRAGAVLARLAHRDIDPPVEALAVAQGMLRLLTGQPTSDIADPLEAALARAALVVDNWDTRASLLWVLVACDRFDRVDAALRPLMQEVRRSGSARGLVAVYSTLGLLKLRLGALPEADAAARVALRVLQDGDFAPGLGFAATVLADIAIEAGAPDAAEALLDLLPGEGWPPGVGTVLIPATRGRLRLVQGRPDDALAEFAACVELFGSPQWGFETHETGYVHARSGAAMALVRLGRHDEARTIADDELADVRVFGARRALGISLRVAGLARHGTEGLGLLRESVAALRESPAVLERAHSLAALGAALRRAGERAEARDLLSEALDLAARCGAPPLARRVREELNAVGARPRRAWRQGVEALTPSELRVARLAAEGRTNREIAHELYVALKTVEGHLARAYAKLEISGRRELATALGEEKTRVPTL